MSSVEEQLGRDIAAVTGGVVVTESELKEAREAVEERLEIGRQRSRRRTVAGLVAAAVVVPIVGVAVARSVGDEQSVRPVSPVGPTPSAITAPAEQWLTGKPPTQDLVQGVWREDNGHLAMRFSPSGTVQIDDLGQLLGAPTYTGTYEVTGGVISIDVDGGTAGCVGARFAMRASIPKPGLMRYVPTDSGTGKCTFSQIGVWGAWEQVLPTGPTWAGFRFPDRLPWQSWPDRDSLFGMWAAQGGGYVLEIDRGGSYYIADETGSTIDRGRWSYRRSGLTLTSSAGSVACGVGDRTQLADLKYVDPGEGTVAMRWTLQTNTCGGAWAEKRWFRIPSIPSP